MKALTIALATAVVAVAGSSAFADVNAAKEPHSVYLQSLQDEYVPPYNGDTRAAAGTIHDSGTGGQTGGTSR
jgi:hypothetical protein